MRGHRDRDLIGEIPRHQAVVGRRPADARLVEIAGDADETAGRPGGASEVVRVVEARARVGPQRRDGALEVGDRVQGPRLLQLAEADDTAHRALALLHGGGAVEQDPAGVEQRLHECVRAAGHVVGRLGGDDQEGVQADSRERRDEVVAVLLRKIGVAHLVRDGAAPAGGDVDRAALREQLPLGPDAPRRWQRSPTGSACARRRRGRRRSRAGRASRLRRLDVLWGRRSRSSSSRSSYRVALRRLYPV